MKKNYNKKTISSLFLLTVCGLFLGQKTSLARYSLEEMRAVESKREGQIRDLRDQEAAQIKVALSRRQPQARRADLYFRLAELNYESYRATFLLEGKVHENRIKNNNALKTIYRGYSKTFLYDGIRVCEEVLKLKIPYQNMDRVYFFLAFNHAELGNNKKSLIYHKELIRRYPNSPLLYESYRAVAENLYEQKKYPASRDMFSQALRLAPAESRAAIFLRIAWTYYRQKQYNAAISELKNAVSETNQDKEKFVSLREELLRDLAYFITERGNAEEAIQYFEQVAGQKDYFAKVMHTLAAEYERRGEKKKAVLVYESIIKSNPAADDLLKTQVKLIMLYLASKQFEAAYGVASKATLQWDGDEEAQAASQNMKALVRKTATSEHESFRKNKEKKHLNVAEQYYALYGERFLVRREDAPEINEIKMYLAEVKQTLGKAKEASEIYRIIVESKDQRYANQAGALWVGALADALTVEAKAQKNAKRLEPSALELEFVKAVDDFVKNVPDSKESQEAQIRATKVLAGYQQTKPQAERRAQTLVKNAPQTSQGHEAARLLIQLALEKVPDPKNVSKGEYENRTSDVQEVVASLSQNAALMAYDKDQGKGQIVKSMAEIESKMKIGKIASFESNNDFTAAAKEYEAYAKNTQSQSDAEKAYENAIGAYVKSQKPKEAERVTFDWFERYPGSKKAVESVQGLATQFLVQGEIVRAASLFSVLGKKTANPEALETSARLLEAIKNESQALLEYEEYLRRYPSGKNRFRVALKLARLHDAKGDEERAVIFYEYCAKGEHVFEAECTTRLGDLYYTLKNFPKSISYYQKSANLGKKMKKGISPFVGYAQYKLALEKEKNIKFSPMTLPDEQLKKSLTERLSFFQQINPAYLEAVNTGGPWGVAALHRLSQWAFRFSEELDAIVPPSGLDAQGVTLFRNKLKEVSLPLRNKALETWRTAYSKANESLVLSPALQEIGDALAQARESRPFRAQGRFGGLRLSGSINPNIGLVRQYLMAKLSDPELWVAYGNAYLQSKYPLLAEIAYDRALSLNGNNMNALNNKAVSIFHDETQEDWVKSQAAFDLFRRVFLNNEFHYEARMNHALLLNYYRLYQNSQNLWEQIYVKRKETDVADGLGVASQAIGQLEEARKYFNEGTALGGSPSRFTQAFHLAAQHSTQGKKGAEQCLSEIGKISSSQLLGFEKRAVDELRKDCEKWKESQ